MRYALLLYLSGAVLLAGSRQTDSYSPPKPGTTQAPDLHTSQNSLDWAGVYEGVLPCQDCPGIKTRLTLNRDGSYARVTQQLGQQNVGESVSGHFTWQANGNRITLDERGGGQQYAVGEGRLTLLGASIGAGETPSSNLVLTLVTPTVKSADLTQQLELYRWTLESAVDSQNRPIQVLSSRKDNPVLFSFSGRRLSIQGPCNGIVGSYRIDAAGQITVNGGASTMMACDPTSMRGDAALSAMLAKPLHVEMESRPSARLRLVSASNETLTLTGQPTPESLYGPGSIIFLEISAQRIPCKSPASPNTSCLQVRERHYDEQGLVVGTPGEWRPFYENIEGFTHREGERNVLRVKRFNRSPATAGASSTVYVLEMIVESEIVTP
jgi:heat shock protein HslJ